MAGIALALGIVGISGITANTVAFRTKEIGIGIALGASRKSVLAMILGQIARLLLLGIGLGLFLSAVLTRLLTSMLFGVTALDPMTFVAVPLVLAAIAFFAAYIPSPRHPRRPHGRTAI
jgi:putative ABC transport system permease protein